MAAHKILVIDDSRVIRNMVKDMLPAENFDVVEAKDGVQGLEMVHKENPWMIMLDFLLPRMSGFEVYENLQQSPELSRIPLILMSGRKEEVTSKIPEPFEDKYLVFIEKPFEQRDLLLAIKKAMTLAQRRPPSTAVAVAVPQEAGLAVDQALLDRVAKLEEQLVSYKVLEERLEEQSHAYQALEQRLKEQTQSSQALEERLEERIKTLEQQLVVQHKQLQQLVTFIRQKVQ